MELKPMPYIPQEYEAMGILRCTVWHAGAADPQHLAPVAGLAEKAAAFLEATLKFRAARSLHLCCYRSHAEACVSLDRCIPPTMALAPFSYRTRGLVVVRSPGDVPENVDLQRMFRVLVHEFAHLLTMEITGSQKRLGDGNRGMRIPAWLHEGFAEVISLLAVDREADLDRCVRTVARTEKAWTFGELSATLDDLNAGERAKAFDRATGAVAWLAAWEGLDVFFAHLSRWSHGLPSNLACSIPTLCRAIGTGSGSH